MQDTFYIVKHSDTCWNLRIKESHFTMSTSSSKEGILDCLYRIILKYRTKKHLTHVLSNLTYTTPLNKDQMQRRVNEEKLSIEYREDVQEVVTRALKDVAKDNEIVRNRSRIKIVNTLADQLTKVDEVPHETGGEDTVVPKKIVKRLKINKVVLPIEEEEE